MCYRETEGHKKGVDRGQQSSRHSVSHSVVMDEATCCYMLETTGDALDPGVTAWDSHCGQDK